MSDYLFISDAAKEVKVESHVLRYWEEELHLPIKRNELGHRYYTEEDVERFKQIKGMKERGLQLKAIKMILKDGKLDVLPEGPVDSMARAVSEGADSGADRTDGFNGQNGQAVSFGENVAKKSYESQSRVSSVGMSEEKASYVKMDVEKQDEPRGLAIDIIPGKSKNPETVQESREDKSRRLQWILQQLIRQAMQENNTQLCREIRESVVKELDYQFRMQEEREEARDKMLAERDEEHYKRMDEVLRRKSLFNKRQRQEEKQKQKMERKQEKRQNKRQEQKMKKQKETEKGQSGDPALSNPVQKKSHFI